MKRIWMGMGNVCAGGGRDFGDELAGTGETQQSVSKGEPGDFDTNVACIELIKERERVMSDMASSKVRLAALEKTESLVQADVDKEIVGDDTLASLAETKMMLDGRLKVMKSGQMGSPDDISNTLIAISSARRETVDRREAIRDRSHGGTYLEITHERLEITIEIQGEQARLDHIEQRLAQLRGEQAKH